MHGSYRSGDIKGAALTASVLCLGVALYCAMFFSMGLQSGRNDERTEKYSNYYRDYAAQRIEKECAGIASATQQRECIAEIVDAQRESQRGESDLGAQWQAANWVLWATVIGAIQLVVSGFGLWALLETIQQGRAGVAAAQAGADSAHRANMTAAEANGISKETMQRQLRPYVYLSQEDVGLELFIDGMLADTAPVVFTVKNFGQSAAKDVKFFGHCTIGGFWNDRADTEELSIQARKVLLGDIAPGHEKLRHGYYVHGLAEAYRDLLSGTRSIFLEGQIQYGDIFGNSYVTNFQLAMTGENFMSEPPNVTNYWNSAT